MELHSHYQITNNCEAFKNFLTSQYQFNIIGYRFSQYLLYYTGRIIKYLLSKSVTNCV